MSSAVPPTASEQPTPRSPGSSLPRPAKPPAGLGRSCSAPLIGSVCVPLQTRAWKVRDRQITFLGPRGQQGVPCLQNIAEEEDAETTKEPALATGEHNGMLTPQLKGDAKAPGTPLAQVANSSQHDVTAPATPVVGKAPTPAPAGLQASASYAETDAEGETDTESAYMTASQDYFADDDSSSIASNDTFRTADEGASADSGLHLPPGFIPAECYTGGIAGWKFTEDRDPYEVFAAAPIEDPVFVVPVSEAENWGWAAQDIDLPSTEVCLQRLEAIVPGISGMDNTKLSKVRISVARTLALWRGETPPPQLQSQPELEPQAQHAVYEQRPEVSQTPVNVVHELPPSSSPLRSSSSSDPGFGHNPSSPSQLLGDFLFGTMPGSYYPASTASSPGRSNAPGIGLESLAAGPSALPESSVPPSGRRHNTLDMHRYTPYHPPHFGTASYPAEQPIARSARMGALAGPSVHSGMGRPCHPRRHLRRAAPTNNAIYSAGMSAPDMRLGRPVSLPSSSAMPTRSFGTGIPSGFYASGQAPMINNSLATLAAPTQGPSGYHTTEAFGPAGIFPASSLADNNGVIPAMYPANGRGSVFQQQPQNGGPANGFMGGLAREDVMLQRFLPSDFMPMPGEFIEDYAQAGYPATQPYDQYETQNAGTTWGLPMRF